MDELKFVELCESFYDGTISDEEKALLMAKVESDEGLKRQFDEFGKLFNGIQSLRDRARLTEILDESFREISQPVVYRTIPIRTRIIHYASVAAVAIVFMLITFYASERYTYIKHMQAYARLGRNVQVLTNYQKSLWDVFFNNQNAKSSYVSGTGFLISSDGLLITSYHLVKDFDSIFVSNEYDSISHYKTELVYKNEAYDVAFLKITDSAFSPLHSVPYTFYTKAADLGEYVYTLGYSKQNIVFGEGAVSSLTGYDEDSSTIQVSVPANPGNSGGPLLNSRGEIVGMICAKNSEKEGTTYALKSDKLLQLTDSLALSDYGKVNIPKYNSVGTSERPRQIKKLRSFVFRVETY